MNYELLIVNKTTLGMKRLGSLRFSGRSRKTAVVYVFSTLRDLPGGPHVARAGAEGCVGVGGIALFGRDLSLDDDVMATGSVRTRRCDDAQPLCHARDFTVDRGAPPIRESQPDRLRRMVELRSRHGYGDPGIPECERSRPTVGLGCPGCHWRSPDRAGSGKAGRRAGIRSRRVEASVAHFCRREESR